MSPRLVAPPPMTRRLFLLSCRPVPWVEGPMVRAQISDDAMWGEVEWSRQLLNLGGGGNGTRSRPVATDGGAPCGVPREGGEWPSGQHRACALWPPGWPPPLPLALAANRGVSSRAAAAVA